MRKIDADALKDKISNISCYVKSPVMAAGFVEAKAKALREIEAAPTEVRHGRWIVRGQEIYCSECNEESLYNPFGASKFSRFCPNCGADMMEVSEDERH